MILAKYKQLLDLPIMSKNTLCKWGTKLGFCYKRLNKKMEVYQRFDVDFVPPTCNFIKNETPEQAFSCKFCKIFKNHFL